MVSRESTDAPSGMVPFERSSPFMKINGDGEVELANKAAFRFLEDWGCEPGDLVPKTVYHKVEKALGADQPQQMQTVLDGDTYILQIESISSNDTVVIQAFDVTEFLENDIRYRTLLQTCPDIFYQLDTDGHIQFINNNVSDFGYSPTGLIDQHITTIVHPDHETLVRRRLVLTEEAVPAEQEEIQADGLEIKLDIPGNENRRFEVRSRRLYDREGHPSDRQLLGTVGVLREITEKRRIQEQLEEKEERLRTMAENFDEVFWMFDGEFEELIYVNRKVEEIYGLPPEQLEEDGRSFFEYIYPDHRSKVKNAVARLRNGEKVELEYRVNKEEDFQRWVSVQGVPIFDDDGSVEKIIGASREITQRKQYEKELEETRKKLKRQTYEDPLLKIPNRRLFSERYGEEWARARRESAPLSMLMVDIDYFKCCLTVSCSQNKGFLLR